MTKLPSLVLTSNSGHRRTRLKMSHHQNPFTPSTGVTLAFTTIFVTILIANTAKLLQPLFSCRDLSFPPVEDNSANDEPLRSSYATAGSSLSLSATAASSFLSNPSGIREWGCHRNETPTIFVHLAKAGGGNNRARFAAGAQNYNRQNWHEPEKDQHYYPIPAERFYGTGPQYRRGKFCNSINHNHLVPKSPYVAPGTENAMNVADPFFVQKKNQLKETFEGSLPCNATTPLGLAVACPQPRGRFCMGCDLRSDHCDTVYVGHNLLGSELHWLPPRYLKRWWENNWVHPSKNNIDLSPTPLNTDSTLQSQIEQTWTRLGSTNDDAVWCLDGSIVHRGRPSGKIWLSDDPSFEKCARTIATEADEQFSRFWPRSDYSPIYASMPLLRTTMLRDPWSWLVSKFHWHHLDEKGLKCDSKLGVWIPWAVREYLLPFCGVDCENRWDRGIMTLEEMAIQAESNLKQSFAVVGLLNETNSFYDMVTTRIVYVDMKLNTQVMGGGHQSVGKNQDEADRCKALFVTTKFQEDTIRRHPELKLIERIYQVAVEVNRFQKLELSQCQRRTD
jgi:hypothetical protein